MGLADFWGYFLAFLLGAFTLPLPIGWPPLPENPALVRTAPHDAVAFIQWSGNAQPAAWSRNRTERLAAQPELRQLVIGLRNGLRGMILSESGEARGEDIGAAFDAVTHCLERPGCAFAFDLSVGRRDIDFSIGVVVDIGPGNAPLVERGMRALAELASDGSDSTRRVSDLEFASVHDSWWSIVDGYLVVAYGENAPERIVAGLRGAADHEGLGSNPRYTGAHGRAAVARPSFRSFVDIARIVAVMRPVANNDFQLMRTHFGFDELQALVTESGLEGHGFVQRSVLSTEAMPAMFKLLVGRALDPGDFAHVPADATVAFGVALSPAKLLRRIVGLAADVDPMMGDDVTRLLFGGLDWMFDLNTEKDLVAHLDDSITIWSSQTAGGNLVYNGLTAAVKLRDAAAFRAGFAKLMGRIEKAAPQREKSSSGRLRHGIFLERIDDYAEPIWFLNAIGEEWVAAPSVCCTDSHLLISLFPQSIVEFLVKAPADGGLDRDPEFQEFISQSDGALSAAMLDVPTLVQLLYPVAQIGAQMALGDLQRKGFGVDIRVLPRLRALTPHLARNFSRTELSQRGLTLTRRGAVPSPDPVAALVLTSLGMRAANFVSRADARAVERAREAALERSRQQRLEQKKARERREQKAKKKRE